MILYISIKRVQFCQFCFYRKFFVFRTTVVLSNEAKKNLHQSCFLERLVFNQNTLEFDICLGEGESVNYGQTYIENSP